MFLAEKDAFFTGHSIKMNNFQNFIAQNYRSTLYMNNYITKGIESVSLRKVLNILEILSLLNILKVVKISANSFTNFCRESKFLVKKKKNKKINK